MGFSRYISSLGDSCLLSVQGSSQNSRVRVVLAKSLKGLLSKVQRDVEVCCIFILKEKVKKQSGAALLFHP